MAANVCNKPVAAVGSKVLLASEQARFGTDTDMGLVTTTGQPPVVFCVDELASLSRLHSLAASSEDTRLLSFMINYRKDVRK